MEKYFNNFNNEEELREKANKYEYWHIQVLKTLTIYLNTNREIDLDNLIFKLSEDVMDYLYLTNSDNKIYGIDIDVEKNKKEYVKLEQVKWKMNN